MRVHVLGVGSIGTLLAYHLRQHLQPAAKNPITLVLKARGVPRVDRHSRRTDRHTPGPQERELDADGPVLGVERNGVYRSLPGFAHELIGPALTTALSTHARTSAFPPSACAAHKLAQATETLASPFLSAAPIDSLVVALKCHHTLPAIQQLAHRLRPDSCVTLVQNGMGVYDELCESVWPDPRNRPQFILGSTTHGARAAMRTPVPFRAVPGGGVRFERSVVHTGVGDIKFGVVPDPRRTVDYDRRLFPHGFGTLTTPTRSVLPLPSLSPDSTTSPTPLENTLSALLGLTALNPTVLPIPLMYQSTLQKLAINCAVNPLTGLLSVTNGALLGSPHTHSIIREVLAECSAVITAYLASISDAPLTPETLATFSPPALERRTTAVLTATARNTSSMASDMSRLQGGGGTEIEYINGFLVRLGERVGVATPVNRTLVDLVGAREEIGRVSPGLVGAGKGKGKRSR